MEKNAEKLCLQTTERRQQLRQKTINARHELDRRRIATRW